MGCRCRKMMGTGSAGRGKSESHVLILILGVAAGNEVGDKLTLCARSHNSLMRLSDVVEKIILPGSRIAGVADFLPPRNLYREASNRHLARTGEHRFSSINEKKIIIISTGTLQALTMENGRKRAGDLVLDEIQDMSPAVRAMVRANLAGCCDRIFLIGDPGQLNYYADPTKG